MMTSGSSFDPRREARRFSLSNNVGRTTTNASASVSAPASVISSGGGMGSSGRSSLITDTAKSFAPHFTSSAAVWTKFKRASIVGEEAGPSSDFDNTSKPNNERSHSVNVSYIYGDNDDEVSPHRSSAQQVSTSSTPQTSSPFSPSNPAVCVSDTAAAASVAADFVAVVDEDKNINDKNNNVVEDTNIQDVVDKDATSLDDGTVNLETQAVEPCLESTDHLETIEETNRTSIDNNDALYPCVPDTDDGDIETNNDGGASGAEELAVEEEGCKSSGADKKRPRSNGISKIMRRFAAHPIDKRLKFANPVATVFEREQKSVATTCNDGAGMNKRSDSVKRKQASHNTTGPPSPDHDSYRLFDEIDELSRDGAALPTGAGITGQAGGWGGVGSHVGRTPTVNLARRQSLPSSSQRNRGRGSMFSKKSLPRAESIIKSGVGKPSKRSPGKAGSSTLKTPGKQQVLVSRFFTSATSASPSSSKTATDSHNRPAAAVDGPQTHQPRIATNASATKEASSSDSPDGNGDGDGDDNNDYNDNTDDEGTALRKDNQVASKATRSKAATAQSTGSPSSRVETAMAAVACAASDRRRSQKRKIDNFRRGAAGKKIRVGSD